MTTIEKIKAEIERLKSIEYPCDNSQQATGFFNALDIMTDFLSTLESEKPVPNDLEEAAKEFAKDAYPDKHNLIWMFKRGAKWDREQMLNEAVETVVSLEAGGFPVVEFGVGKFGLKVGDKVRVIIVKEDEKLNEKI